jgi:hypothetical protein
VHLLLRASPLQPPSGFMLCKVAPSFRLPKPFPTIVEITLGTLAVHQFHCAAVGKVAHRVTSVIADIVGHLNSEEKATVLTFRIICRRYRCPPVMFRL